nr:hypothetical protein [Pandoravirus belohorizontensis]
MKKNALLPPSEMGAPKSPRPNKPAHVVFRFFLCERRLFFLLKKTDQKDDSTPGWMTGAGVPLAHPEGSVCVEIAAGVTCPTCPSGDGHSLLLLSQQWRADHSVTTVQ